MDARDPMFYASHDLATYVSEVAGGKTSVFLLNKADYLTAEQRQIWAEFFKRSDMKTLFFSATDINDRLAVGHSKIVTGSQQVWSLIYQISSAIHSCLWLFLTAVAPKTKSHGSGRQATASIGEKFKKKLNSHYILFWKI